jgi:hypothetical protein
MRSEYRKPPITLATFHGGLLRGTANLCAPVRIKSVNASPTERKTRRGRQRTHETPACTCRRRACAHGQFLVRQRAATVRKLEYRPIVRDAAG